MRAIVLSIAALLVAMPAASGLSLLTAPESGEAIVGYREGTLFQAEASILALGGSILSVNEDLRFIVLSVGDLTRFLAGIVLAVTVEYAEKNDPTRLDGAQWNGAQWNGAQWNGAQWNGDTADSSDPGVDWQWGLARVKAADAWNVSVGDRRASLCVLDSGVDLDHRDLVANLGAGHNAIDPRLPPDDDAGHGTHIAGIAAATVGNGFGTAGVANVTILPVKVLSADGTGKEDDLAAGLVWCANQRAHVAVMALGVDDDGPTVRRAIAYAKARDVLMLASAGNGACADCVGFPARHRDVVAVGATDADDLAASFSSRGGQVEIAAPGVEILSTFLHDEFRYGSGTSQAVAFAAGAAALLRDTEPGLGAADARARLREGARDIGQAGRDEATGYGLVDAAATLGAA